MGGQLHGKSACANPPDAGVALHIANFTRTATLAACAAGNADLARFKAETTRAGITCWAAWLKLPTTCRKG